MNQYIKFIVRVLLTCFFIAFLGGIIQVLCGLEQYLWGWFWGIFRSEERRVGTECHERCISRWGRFR